MLVLHVQSLNYTVALQDASRNMCVLSTRPWLLPQMVRRSLTSWIFLAHHGTTTTDLLAASVTTVWNYKIRASDGEKWRVAFQGQITHWLHCLLSTNTLCPQKHTVPVSNFNVHMNRFDPIIEVWQICLSCLWFWSTPTSAAFAWSDIVSRRLFIYIQCGRSWACRISVRALA